MMMTLMMPSSNGERRCGSTIDNNNSHVNRILLPLLPLLSEYARICFRVLYPRTAASVFQRRLFCFRNRKNKQREKRRTRHFIFAHILSHTPPQPKQALLKVRIKESREAVRLNAYKIFNSTSTLYLTLFRSYLASSYYRYGFISRRERAQAQALGLAFYPFSQIQNAEIFVDRSFTHPFYFLPFNFYSVDFERRV